MIRALALFTFALFTGAHAFAEACTVGGPENAPLTIQEFVDMECKYCAKGAATLTEVLRNYPTQVKVVLRHLPLEAHGEGSATAAKAVIAVCLQSSALGSAFEHEVFAHQNILVKEGEKFLKEAAMKIGADPERMKTDMNGEVVAKQLSADMRDALAFGFKGTPSFVIGTETLVGAYPYDKFKEIVDRQLAEH